MSNDGLLFTIIDDSVILYHRSGTFHQKRVAVRGSQLYAALTDKTFIRLMAGGDTTNPAYRWQYLEIKYRVGEMGRLHAHT